MAYKKNFFVFHNIVTFKTADNEKIFQSIFNNGIVFQKTNYISFSLTLSLSLSLFLSIYLSIYLFIYFYVYQLHLFVNFYATCLNKFLSIRPISKLGHFRRQKTNS